MKRKYYRYKKKAKIARKNRRNNIVSIPRLTAPNKVFVKLRYVSNPFTFPTVAIPPSVQTSVLTYGNDPTSSLPTAFDQWSAFFQRYTVFASKIKLHMFTAGSSAGTTIQPVKVSLLPSDQAIAGGTGLAQAFTDRAGYSMPYVKSTTLDNTQYHGSAVLKHFAKTKKLYPNKDIEDETLFSGYTGQGGTTLSSPGNRWNWIVVTESLNPASTSASAIFGWYEVTYFMMFSDPITQADS